MSKGIDRTVLPIHDQKYAGYLGYEAKDPASRFNRIELAIL